MAIQYDEDEKGKFAYVECDDCGETRGNFIRYNSQHLCESCFKATLPKMIVYQPEDSEYELYLYDDEWYSEDEIHDQFIMDSDSTETILHEQAEYEYERMVDARNLDY